MNHDGSYVYSGLAKTVVSTMSCIVIRLFMSHLSGSLYYIIIYRLYMYISAVDWHAIYICTDLYRYSLIHWLSLRGIPKTYVLSSILVVDQMMYMVVHKFLPRKPPVCKTLIVSVGSMHEYVLHKNVKSLNDLPFLARILLWRSWRWHVWHNKKEWTDHFPTFPSNSCRKL